MAISNNQTGQSFNSQPRKNNTIIRAESNLVSETQQQLNAPLVLNNFEFGRQNIRDLQLSQTQNRQNRYGEILSPHNFATSNNNNLNITQDLPPRRSEYINDLATENFYNFSDQFSFDGFFSLRPEILSLQQFKPLYIDNKETVVNKFTTFRNVSNLISKDFSNSILENIDKDSNGALNLKKQELSNELNLIKTKLNKTLKFYSEIDKIKLVFEIKKENQIIDFLKKYCQYKNDENIIKFTDTKILYQIIFSVKEMLEQNAYIEYDDFQKTNDVNPFYIKPSNKIINYNILKSISNNKNSNIKSNFDSILNLFQDSSDINLKNLYSLLLKEYIVSSNLKINSNKNILTTFFNATTTIGNPFDNIFGATQNSIFDKPSGFNALTNICELESREVNKKVLVFENKFIATDSLYFTPGSYLFVDSEIDNKTFRANLFSDYSRLLNNIVSNSSILLNGLFLQDFRNKKELFVERITSVFSNLSDKKNRLELAILRDCVDDKQLFYLIFQYFNLVYLFRQRSNSSSTVVERIKKELVNLSGLPSLNSSEAIPTIENILSLYPKLENLALEIENYIFNKYNSGENNFGLLQFQAENSITKNEIKEILTRNINSTENSLFVSILNTFEETELDFNSLLEDSSGRTVFNFISTTYMFLIYNLIVLNYVSLLNLSSFDSLSQNNINLIINTNNTSTVIQSINNRVNSYLNLEQKQIEDFINLLSLLKIKTINSATAFETLIRSVNEDNFIFLTRDQIYLLFKEFEIENNSKEHLNLLQSYTKEIQDTDWKYILTVGLPYKSIIANRNISRNNADINSTREEITILIHKKNDIYPDIKFKPIKFNISSKLIDIIPEEINIENSYAQNLDKIKFLNTGNDKIEKTSFNDFINKSNLSENDLKYFIESKILNQYSKLTTGIDWYENIFLLENEFNFKNIPQDIKTLLSLYYKTNDPINTDIFKNEIDILLSNNFKLFLYNEYKKIFNISKKFDKIINIMIDLKMFEIDNELTNKTDEGKKILQSKEIIDKILVIGDKQYLADNIEICSLFIEME